MPVWVEQAREERGVVAELVQGGVGGVRVELEVPWMTNKRRHCGGP